MPSYDAGEKNDLMESLRWLKLDYEEVEENSGDNESNYAVIVAKDSIGLTMQSRTVPDKTIPSVVGMGLKDAIYLLENRGCRVRAEGVGKVRRQSLAPGTRASGQTCVLFLE
jgi:cell division protein FtsI (penicillin-binding protein 3)